MPVRLSNRTAVLEGVVTVEETEPLTAWLRTTPTARVNLRDCTHLHTSALQALLAARVKISSQPADVFLRVSVIPALERLQPSTAAIAPTEPA